MRGRAAVSRLLPRSRGYCAILVLHGLVEWVDDPETQLNHVEAVRFAELLDTLAQRFRFVRLEEVEAAISAGREPPSDSLALTFDDGYRSNLTLAEPLLRERGIPFSVFVSTRPVEEHDRLPTYRMRVAIRHTDAQELRLPGSGEALPLRSGEERTAAIAFLRTLLKSIPQAEVDALVLALVALLPAERWLELDARFASEELLTWEEVRELRARGATIGSHCHDHAVLHASQSETEIRRQLAVSKALLERRLGEECRHFCYPNGTQADISPAAHRLAADVGYATALTNIAGTVTASSDPWFLPRLYVQPDVRTTVAALRRLPDTNRALALARARLEM